MRQLATLAVLSTRYKASTRSLHMKTVFLTAVLLLLPAIGMAQSSTSSTIYGVVKDSTGATLPGVTVTLTSPAIQVAEMVVVTGVDGNYRLTDLPAGIYQIVYDLTGFAKTIRSDVQITTGFMAKIDIVMA